MSSLPHADPYTTAHRDEAASVRLPHDGGATNLLVNLATASEFTCALAAPGELLTFQSFDDTSAKRPHLVRVLHTRRFGDVAPALARLNAAGAGIFLTVNETNGQGRTAENIVRVRALFVDADSVPRPAHWHAEPDFIVWRDKLHWHGYWLVADLPLNGFGAAQRRLAKLYGTDPKIHDLPRVMRVPGFLHRKGAPEPVLFERGQTVMARSAQELLAGLPEEPQQPAAPPPITCEPGDTDGGAFEHWVMRVAAEAVVGNRNNCLFCIACEGHGRGLPQATVRAICGRFANGLSEREVDGLVASAFRRERTAHPPQPAAHRYRLNVGLAVRSGDTQR
ncbi:MAG: DNA-primase RepB domain-containing protein [Planctomycetota bacterium]|nr:DNA-primase RepB domain-containing protein [Planctomycetota bacterium]